MSKFKMIRTKMKDRKGFTLIEMIIVIAIIAILIALVAPNLLKFLETSKQAKRDGAAKTLYTSAQAYITEKELAGDPITAGWSYGGDLTFEKEYFNSEEFKNITAYTVTLKEGSVEKVELTMDAKKALYPKEAPAAPIPPVNPNP